jgi:hypothetical protein
MLDLDCWRIGFVGVIGFAKPYAVEQQRADTPQQNPCASILVPCTRNFSTLLPSFLSSNTIEAQQSSERKAQRSKLKGILDQQSPFSFQLLASS